MDISDFYIFCHVVSFMLFRSTMPEIWAFLNVFLYFLIQINMLYTGYKKTFICKEQNII